MSFSFDRCSCGRLNIRGATCVCESEPRHDGAVGDARKRGAAPAPVPDDDIYRTLPTLACPTPTRGATMPDRILTDDDCARIVAASIDPGRVLGGIDGHDGGEPDMLLTTVEGIVAERSQAAKAAAFEEGKRATWQALGAPFVWASPDNPYEEA